jgi:hypothetical protein
LYHQGRKKLKSVTKLDVSQERTVHDMYDTREFPVVKKILKCLKIKINSSGLLRSVYNILHQWPVTQ